MNGLDLFSGIGGLTRALAGYVTPVAYCENDRYAQSVLLSRMADGQLPTAPIWDDVTSLSGSVLPSGINIVYGGFPCQDISVIGGREGLEGKRSGLFFEIIRLVKELRPAFVFLENVAGIRTRGGSRVIAEFSALRYDCRWGMLSAYDVGAPHRRERWWMLAHAHGEHGQRGAESHQSDSAFRATRTESEGVRDALAERRLRGSVGAGCLSGGIGAWSIEPNVGRVAHGIPARMERLKCLGNAVVPAQAREAFERLIGVKK